MVNRKTKQIIIIIAIAVLAMPIHELGHWLGYNLSGIPATLHYSFTEPINNIHNIWGLVGGPLISLLVASFAALMIYRNTKNQDIWAFLSIVMCLTRVLPYLVLIVTPNSFAENDEGLIASVLNVPVWLVYVLFISLFMSILFALTYNMKGNLVKHIRKYKFGYFFYLLLVIVTGIQII